MPNYTRIRTVLMPSLGTGVGSLPFTRFASQFALAFKHFDEALERGPWKDKHRFWTDISPIQHELEQTFES